MSLIILVVGLLMSYSVEGYKIQAETSAFSHLKDQDVSVCDICVDYVDIAHSLIANGEIEKLIKDVNDLVCQFLPGSFSTKCENLVDSIISENYRIINAFLDQNPSKTVCQFVNLCPESKVEGYQIQAETQDVSVCDICVDFLDVANSLITNDQIEKLIKDVNDAVCNVIPGPTSSKCLEMVDIIITGGYKFIKDLLAKYPPNSVCQLVKMCPNSIVDGYKIQAETSALRQLIDQDVSVCDICVDYLDIARSLITNGEIQKLIKDFNDGLCQFIPGDLSSKCEEFVDSIITENYRIIKDILDKNPSKTVCQGVYLCPNPDVEGYKIQADVSVCDICVDYLGVASSLITNDQIEKLIKDFDDGLCQLLPGSASSQCQQMVDTIITEGYSIITDILAKYPPKAVCQLVMLCPGEGYIMQVKTSALSKLTDQDVSVCDICVDYVGIMDSLIANGEIEKLINDFNDGICQFLPGDLSSKCEQMVDGIITEGYKVIKDFIAQNPPKAVCQIVSLCPIPSVTHSMTSIKTSFCDVCVDTLVEGESAISSKEVEKLSVDFTDFACALIPNSTLAKKCKDNIADRVSVYYSILRQQLQNFPPRDLCELARLCSSEYAQIFTALKVQKTTRSEQKTTRYEQEVTLCDLCEDALAVGVQVFTDEKLEQAVATDTKFACTFTGPFREMCENQVDQAITLSFDIIRSMFGSVDNHQVCVDFDFCGDANKTTVCDVCKGSYGKVKNVLVSEKLKNIIVTSSKYGCRVFKPFQQICENAVLGVVDEIFIMIHRQLDLMDGESFCKEFYMCGGKKVLNTKVEVGFCDACKETITTIEDQLTNEKTEDMVDDLVKRGCAFTGPYKDTCETLIDGFSTKVFELAREAFGIYSAEQLCKAMFIC